MSCFSQLLGIIRGSLLQIPSWPLLQPGGTFASWDWRWDPALELELGWAPFQACALLNIFIIFNSHFPSCIQVAAALGRDGDPASGSEPWGRVTQGWDKEDVTHMETAEGFNVFMSLAQLPLPKFPSEGLKFSRGTQDVQWVTRG